MRSRTRVRAAIEGLENRLVLSTYVVNTFVDQIDPRGSNTVSIRDALAMVLADSSNDTMNDTIDVPAGDYKLALGALVIYSYQPVTIQSTGGLATIDAQSLSANVFDATQFGAVSLSGLVITGASGQASSVGLTPSAAVEYASDNMNVTDCVITDNAGVAMHSSYEYATTELSGVTISNNAGGLECGDGSRLDISNSTITGNTSTAVQGPFFFGIYDSTIVDNSGAGVITYDQATIANSIIAGNGEDLEGYVESFGGNVIGNIGTSTGWGGLDKFGSAALPLGSLLLAPLGNYGGPTPTMPPLEGSPALSAGFTATIAADSTDQRGLPRIVNGAVDSGAVETQKPPSIRLTAASSQVFTESGTVMLGSFSAPGINGPYAVVIGWGDGSPDTVVDMNAAGAIPPQFHSFREAGLFRVTVGVIDVESDLSNAASFNATVVGAGPPTTIVVNTDKDQTDPSSSQTVSLRDAIAKADQATGPVHIAFSPTIFATPQTLTLSGAPLNIGGAPFAPLTITGPTAGLTIDIGAAITLTIQSDTNVAFNGINFSGTAPKPDFDSISNAGILTITHSTISGLLDGVINNGALALRHVVISGSNNGAITNNGGMILNDSTVSGNTDYEAGIYNSGIAFIYNCTITANNRYGIENTGRALVTSCTITGNYSAGIDNPIHSSPLRSNGAGTVTLSNSIVASNATAYASFGYAGDIVGAVNSLGHNLIGEVDGSSGWISSDLTGTVAVPLDPKLSPLGYYGGSTQTQFPFPDSPALGAGSAALVPAGVTTDQRGFTRIVGGKVDIGADQSQPPANFSITPPAAQSAVAGTAKTFTLGSFSDPGASGPFVVTIFWDDGASVSTFNLSGVGSLGTLRHAFNATGAIFNTIVVADRARNVALGAFIVHSSPRALSTLVVNTIDDSTDSVSAARVSLRDAIDRADASFGPVNITFSPAVFGTARTLLLNGLIPGLSANHFGLIQIIGPAPGVAIESANNDILVAQGVTAVFSDITFLQTGIVNSGTTALIRSTIAGASDYDGGAIYNSAGGIFSLVDSTISGSTATGYTNSGGRGGDYHRPGYGGAIYNAGSLVITSSTLSGNNADDGGAISNSGTATIYDSTISANSAAFAYNIILAGPSGSGGAIDNSGRLLIANSTLSGNYANFGGGAIANSGTTTIYDSTISANSAVIFGYGGIINYVPMTVTLSNTIVAGNSGSLEGLNGELDVNGAFVSLGHNLIGQTDGSTGWIGTDITGTFAHPVDPKLSPLGNFGGPTQTMLPLSGSRVRAAGSASLIPSGDITDQRGLARVVNGKVDIGAVEIQKQSPYGGSPAPFGLIQAENFDLGGPGAGYYNPTNLNRGGLYRPTEGVGIGAIPSADGGGYFVGWTLPGEYLNYTASIASTGAYTLEFRVASQPKGGTFHMNVDGKNVTGELSVPSTGDWNKYVIVSKTGVKLSAGTHALQLVFDTAGSAGVIGNFDWLALGAI